MKPTHGIRQHGWENHRFCGIFLRKSWEKHGKNMGKTWGKWEHRRTYGGFSSKPCLAKAKKKPLLVELQKNGYIKV